MTAAADTTHSRRNLLSQVTLICAAVLLLDHHRHHLAGVDCIGVNYGTHGSDLPSPSSVAAFLRSNTTIDAVKIFDSDPDILRSFSDSPISVVCTAADAAIPSLSSSLAAAHSWVNLHVSPFHPSTRFRHILVGNEIMATGNRSLITLLLPAMRNLHTALLHAGISHVTVTTPHSLGVLSISHPPSRGRFRRVYDHVIFRPILDFLRRTRSPFMVNPYPYFAYSTPLHAYSLFKTNPGVTDPFTRLTYYNMFDAMLDAVHSAMAALGYGDVAIAVGETGWPSQGDPGQPAVGPDFAASFNRALVRHVTSGKGTPLMPNRTFETFVFALFNENLKPGPVAERNFGLFRPDFSAVYDAGVLKGAPNPKTHAKPAPGVEKRWCVAKEGAREETLQANIDFVCGNGVDCGPIQSGGRCFNPNDVRSHASFVMDSYYKKSGRNGFDCDFGQSGALTTINPSHGSCEYPY